MILTTLKSIKLKEIMVKNVVNLSLQLRCPYNTLQYIKHFPKGNKPVLYHELIFI